MSQNISHAVMQQRHEAHDSLDDFPTPPWAARALCKHVICVSPEVSSVWEPACNRGYLLKGLKGYFKTIHASDVHDYGCGYPVRDFLFPGPDLSVDWVITNPPFRLAEQFAVRGLEVATEGVALLTRIAFLEGISRYQNLFAVHRPSIIAQFCERVPMVKGRHDPKISSATAYCWIVWLKNSSSDQTLFWWIPPCRKQLERGGDAP